MAAKVGASVCRFARNLNRMTGLSTCAYTAYSGLQRASVLGIGGRSASSQTEQEGQAAGADVPSLDEAPLTFEAAASRQPGGGGSGPAAAAGMLAQQPLQLAQPTGSSASAADAAAGAQPAGHAVWPDLSTVGPLQLAFVSFVAPPAAGAVAVPEMAAGGSATGNTALFEVVPAKSTPANSSGWCSVAGWPMRWVPGFVLQHAE